MIRRRIFGIALTLAPVVWPAAAQGPELQAPQPTVPQVFTLMGQYVRIAYNNTGYASLGYRTAQNSIGQDWMLLEVGLSMRAGTKDYTLKRADLSVKTPDGTIVPLAKQSEYGEAGYLSALNKRASVVRDSINYFPNDAYRACSIHFFANLGQGPRQIAYDEVELSSTRACVGRLYFKIPGGIKVGQYWLLVNFNGSEVQVPFRIFTKEEKEKFEDEWEELKKAHDDSLK
jgi:hypothetical protein